MHFRTKSYLFNSSNGNFIVQALGFPLLRENNKRDKLQTSLKQLKADIETICVRQKQQHTT